MGWTGNHDRKAYVANFMLGWKSDRDGGLTITIRKHHEHHTEDWFILDVAKTATGENLESLITMMLWENSMVKHMDEASSPYFYGCPLSWLDEVPAPTLTCGPWRERRLKLAELSQSTKPPQSAQTSLFPGSAVSLPSTLNTHNAPVARPESAGT